ncbi:hypothetical protein ACFVTX_09950 [Agromyces sp. NPDC058136]|uniref:hypothetical protein n=1 Tax=Agromyces sp. NPDC058136 TaxID=3346354 RepID=UPI0036DA5B0E
MPGSSRLRAGAREPVASEPFGRSTRPIATTAAMIAAMPTSADGDGRSPSRVTATSTVIVGPVPRATA